MRGVTVANPEEAKEVIQAEIRKTDESRLQHRLHCVLLICVGKTCAEAAVLFGDSMH